MLPFGIKPEDIKKADCLTIEGIKFFKAGKLKETQADFEGSKKDYSNAIQKFEAALKSNKKSLAALNYKSFALERLGYVHMALSKLGEMTKDKNLDVALKSLERAVKIRPDDKEILKGLGFVLIGKKEFRSAAGYFQRAVKIYPNDIEALEALKGLEYSQRMDGRSEQALETCTKLLAADPANKGATKTEMQSLLARRLEEAKYSHPKIRRDVYLEMLKLDENNLEALVGIANLYYEVARSSSGRDAEMYYARAYKYFMKLYEIDPTNKIAIVALADSRINKKNPDEFHELAKEMGCFPPNLSYGFDEFTAGFIGEARNTFFGGDD